MVSMMLIINQLKHNLYEKNIYGIGAIAWLGGYSDGRESG